MIVFLFFHFHSWGNDRYLYRFKQNTFFMDMQYKNDLELLLIM